jgi:hypothetical protein
MRLPFLVVLALLGGALMAGASPARAAQASQPSSSGAAQSSEQATPPAEQAPAAASPAAPRDGARPEDAGNLPVSLDHIRQALKRDATTSLLKQIDIPVDFRVHILEQQKINDMLSKLDFKSGTGPVPPGGIYGYEQQRRLFNPVDNPLAQPYSAFSGGELITIAIENLIAHYVAGPIVNGLSDAERARAERAAREEVARDIADYCSRRSDRAQIEICRRPIAR